MRALGVVLAVAGGIALGAGIEIPVEGEGRTVSVVVEDEAGRRVRNLVSGQVLEGDVVWDGRDEFGALVEAGRYRVRGLVHDGVRAEFRFQFANGDEDSIQIWGSDHSMVTAVASDARYVAIGSALCETGCGVSLLTHEGRWVKGFRQAHGGGVDFVSLALDEDWVYAVQQGEHFRDQAGDVRPRLALSRYSIERGNVEPIGGRAYAYFYTSKKTAAEVEAERLRRPTERHCSERILRGAALYEGRIVVANGESERVMFVDPETAEVVREVALEKPSSPVVVAGELWVASGRNVCVWDAGVGAFRGVFSVAYEVEAMSARGEHFALLGAEDSTLRVVTRAGREVGRIGEAGGAYTGAWKPKRLVNPVGVTWLPDGTFWTTEARRNPERMVRWSEAGEIVYEKFGCPGYGSPSGAFCGEDARRFIAENVEWRLEDEAKRAEPVRVLSRGDAVGDVLGLPVSAQWVRHGGREYMVGAGPVTQVAELLPEGRLQLVAVVGNLWSMDRMLVHNCEGFNRFARGLDAGYFEETRVWKKSRRGVFWQDRNGDGVMDEEEFELFPAGKMVDSSWGITSMGLTLRFPFQEEGKGEVLVTLEPEGKAGVRYDLARALREAKPIVRETLPQGLSGVSGRECYNDLRGNVVINSSPWMVSLNGEGGVNWFVSNKWPNVGGSHSAPPLTRGVLQGVLFALGVAPLDAEGDVMALIGNMGPVFLMTTDGLYVDRLFKDGRVYGTLDYQNLRGEPFGGTFQYDAATKSYVMQAGHGGYRMYRIEGLETVRRFAGEVEVTEAFLREAMAQEAREEAREGEAKESEVHRVGKVDANARRLPLVAEWQRGEGRCRVMGAYDEEQLVLRWEVEDASPWKNEGAEWTHLFKTGDSVDVQLGLPGGAETVRLLVAPYAGGSVAVLYRFLDGKGARVEGRNPVEFASPWRSFWVDDVRRLEGVKPRVEKRAGGYVVTVAVPWRELGVTAESLAGVRRGDFGVIFGDAAGRVNVSRSYWANQATGLVSDVPGEVEPRPKEWGRVDFVTGEETLKAEFVGVVGNSGTEEKPVQMGPYEVGGQSQAGPYFDEATGLLYETAGSQRLNVLGLDGVVRRSYRIPAGKFATRGEPLVRVGESLYFRRNERLWRVGVSEADGAEAERAACELEGIRMLSSSARDGEIALWLKDQTLWLWNAETGMARNLGALELRLESLDWNRSGTLFAFTQDTVYKLEEGSIVTQDGFPKKVIGRGVPLARGCFTGGAYYAVSHSGSVLRLNEETLEPDPGVVFGGAGGHTLMAVFIDRDIDNGSGVVHVGEDLFAVGGASGVVTLLRWNAREEKLERVRRLGSIPEVPTLELSREGIIHAGRVGFAWNADAQAPCVTSWNVGARVSARFGEDRCLRLGKNAYGAVEAGPLEAVMRRPYIHKREMDDFSGAVGVAIREDREAYVLWPTGIVKRYRFSCGVAQLMFEAAGEVSLRLSEPCETFSGFVHVDDEAFLLIAGGRIVQVEPRGEDLVEVGRWDETFSQDIRMACDGEHVAIAEPSENRVRVFTRAGKEVGRVAVSSPGAVAIRGRNLVVFELDPQRVAKYRLHRMMKEQGVER